MIRRGSNLLYNKKIYLVIALLGLFFYNNTQQSALTIAIQNLSWIKLHEAPYTDLARDKLQQKKPKLQLPQLQDSIKQSALEGFAPRIDIANDNNIEVDFPKVSYEGFSGWLSEINQKFDLNIVSMDIERLNDPTLVHLKIVFSGAA
jgi:type II secretory pathway component PulM